MPEMPEVETIARRLRRSVLGKRVDQVNLSGLPLRRPVQPDLAEKLRGRTIMRVHRQGKYLIAETDPHGYWVIHLGMSGRIFFGKPMADIPKHTHAVLRFSDSTELHYRDHRRFGLLSFYEVESLRDIPELKCLGRNPLGAGFRTAWLFTELRKSRQEIKSFLLDQGHVAGLGNIYVCEALFRARIHPTRRCHTLEMSEVARLVPAVRDVLRDAIRHRGTSFSDFMDSDGRRGGHQLYLAVFQREGERCAECGAKVRRLRQGNRSSYYCPRCQK